MLKLFNHYITNSVTFVGGISTDIFELLCRDGSRATIDKYQTCNWGMIPTNAIVASSVSSIDERRKYQTFLQRIVELYGAPTSTLPQPSPPPNFDYNENNYADRSGYDGMDNRTRYKRQGLGDFRTYQDKDNNRLGLPQNRYDQYGRSDENRYNDPYRNNYPNGRDYDRDPNYIQPHDINSDRYGVNIDPYGPRIPYIGTDGREGDGRYDEDSRGRNNETMLYEVFNMFESIPRYGIHGNLMFQV